MVKELVIESNHDKLNNALGGSKWAGKDIKSNLYTDKGIELLSARCEFSGLNNTILYIKGADGEYIKDRYSGKSFNFLTNDFHKNFKAYKTLHGRMDSQSLNYINDILTTYDKTEDIGRYNYMGDMDRSTVFTLYRTAGVREPGVGTQQPDGVPVTPTPILDRVPVTPTPIFDRVIEEMGIGTPEVFINNLIGVPEDELRAKGFTAHVFGRVPL